jgi:hypothetical protein
MTGPMVAATARMMALVAALVFVACGSQTDGTGTDPSATATTRRAAVRGSDRPQGVVEDCSTRSQAAFPDAFADARNVVVGPLVLVGAAHTSAGTVREFRGNKFPALVRAGHRVTVAIAPSTRRVASLGYGPLPEGVELSPSDGHPVVSFIACKPGKPSSSTVDGQAVTFWSGFVLANSPRCVPLEVWVDDEPAPRRTALRMGVRRCP